MHEASWLMLPCNLTVTQQSLQSHTRARETKMCLLCMCGCLWARVCICVHIRAGRLVPIQWFVIMSTHNSTCMSKPMLESQHWFNFCCLSSFPLFSLHRNTLVSHFCPSHTHTYTQRCYKCHKLKSRVSCSILALYCFLGIVSFSLGS